MYYDKRYYGESERLPKDIEKLKSLILGLSRKDTKNFLTEREVDIMKYRKLFKEKMLHVVLAAILGAVLGAIGAYKSSDSLWILRGALFSVMTVAPIKSLYDILRNNSVAKQFFAAFGYKTVTIEKLILLFPFYYLIFTIKVVVLLTIYFIYMFIFPIQVIYYLIRSLLEKDATEDVNPQTKSNLYEGLNISSIDTKEKNQVTSISKEASEKYKASMDKAIDEYRSKLKELSQKANS